MKMYAQVFTANIVSYVGVMRDYKLSIKNYGEYDSDADVDYFSVARYIRLCWITDYLLIRPISYLGRVGY